MSGTKKGPRRDGAKERFWRKLLARWRRSGQKGREFCASEGVSAASFYAWRRELMRRDEERVAKKSAGGATPAHSSFVPLRMIPGNFAPLLPPSQSPSSCVELVLPSGHVLRVPPGCDRATLATVLSALEPRAC